MLTKTIKEKRLAIGDRFVDPRYPSRIISETIGTISVQDGQIDGFVTKDGEIEGGDQLLWLEMRFAWTKKEYHEAATTLKDKRRVYWFNIFCKDGRIRMIPKLSQDIDPVTGENNGVQCPYRLIANDRGYRNHKHFVKFESPGFAEETATQATEEALRLITRIIPRDKLDDAHSGKWQPELHLVPDGAGI